MQIRTGNSFIMKSLSQNHYTSHISMKTTTANSLTLPFFIMLAFFYAVAPADSSSNETDLRSLLVIKAAIVSDPLGALSSWNETNHFCRWKGVFCGKKHPTRVVAINLMSQGLSGSLPPHVGNMSFLRRINLSNNSFHGQIPEAIGRLRRLEHMNFSTNSFSGVIPGNLSQCSNLFHIDLLSNNLTGTIPPELGSLYKLNFLYLGKNKLSGIIPPSIGNLTALEKLSSGYCGLQGEIPESIVQLRSLAFFSLGQNRLSGNIPFGLYNISTLSTLSLHSNQFQGVIPPDIGFTLPNLEFLGLGGNKFTGNLPISLSNASLLQDIDFSDNDFVGPVVKGLGTLSKLEFFTLFNNQIRDDIHFISSMTNCTNMISLQLSRNLLSGSLPNSIANLSSQLNVLDLAYNEIHGSIPSGIENLQSLTILALVHNNFDGPIPSEIGKLSNLGEIYMGGNRFTNELPPSIGNLTLLTILALEFNNIYGSIPQSLGNLTMLLQLSLSRNSFNGLIPPEIMKLSSISISFDLSDNALTGPIPSEVGSLKNLLELDLSNNRFSGTVPETLSSCTILQQLYLQGNSLEGEIVASFDALEGLLDLDLSRNNFSGAIPSFLSQLHLENLNISFNRLQGEVPISGIFANKTAVSLDGNNDLCGGIPELNLPPCQENIKKKNLSAILKISIPTAICGIIAASLLVFYCMRQRRSKNNITSQESLDPQFLRISYADLLKATDGFSDANLVGAGRFGSVYKGILEDGMTLVAVKVLNLHVKGAPKSFVAECNALRGIRHRNLLKILSVCSSTDFTGNDFKALVYEYHANGSLDKWLHQEKDGIQDEQLRYLTVIQRLDIAIDVASAIEYLHSGTESVIVHGDLKPSNILLDNDMTAHVGDFGLTKIISSISLAHPTHESSSSIGIKGTIGYIAPEYGMSDLVSVQGDVYSYGIILLEMYAKKRPTDDAFKDHSNLQSFIARAFPDNIKEIVDPLILRTEHDMDSKMELMISVFRIGLACSQEIPGDRMPIGDVVHKLRKTRDTYLRSRIPARTY